MFFRSSVIVCAATLVVIIATATAKSAIPISLVPTVVGQQNNHDNKDNKTEVHYLPLTRQDEQCRMKLIRYTIGERVAGDYLLTQRNEEVYYSPARNVSLQLRYRGTHKSNVTYVEMLVTQAAGEGSAYVKDGGIGQPFILINVEANNTSSLSYQAQFYGIN